MIVALFVSANDCHLYPSCLRIVSTKSVFLELANCRQSKVTDNSLVGACYMVGAYTMGVYIVCVVGEIEILRNA